MPLRDIAALLEWRLRDDPPEWVVARVNEWVLELAVVPWRAPSMPEQKIEDGGGNPITEICTATLTNADDTVVIYQYDHSTLIVDLLYVGR